MTDSETKYAIRMILITASLGGMSYLSFNNGLLVAYFSYLGIPSATILILLALLPLSQFVFMIPFSYLSDIYGKKLIGNFGLVLSSIGFFLMAVASNFSETYLTLVVGLGAGIFGTGSALIIGNWFALLHPIIPENIRGRFFGRIRLTWQSIGIIMTLIAIYILEQYPTLEMYQAVIGFIAILLAVRMIYYQRIPELDIIQSKRETFRKSFMKVLAIPEYLSFCAYCFF